MLLPRALLLVALLLACSRGVQAPAPPLVARQTAASFRVLAAAAGGSAGAGGSAAVGEEPLAGAAGAAGSDLVPRVLACFWGLDRATDATFLGASAAPRRPRPAAR